MSHSLHEEPGEQWHPLLEEFRWLNGSNNNIGSHSHFLNLCSVPRIVLCVLGGWPPFIQSTLLLCKDSPLQMRENTEVKRDSVINQGYKSSEFTGQGPGSWPPCYATSTAWRSHQEALLTPKAGLDPSQLPSLTYRLPPWPSAAQTPPGITKCWHRTSSENSLPLITHSFFRWSPEWGELPEASQLDLDTRLRTRSLETLKTPFIPWLAGQPCCAPQLLPCHSDGLLTIPPMQALVWLVLYFCFLKWYLCFLT